MDLIVFFFFILFFLSSTNVSVTGQNCSVSKCGDTSVVVKFPFQIKNLNSNNCGSSGFDITCSSFGLAILELPFSNNFFVREINYVKQEIRIYDPENCLPRRLLSLNLSGSPFFGMFYQEYTFLNCSLGFNVSGTEPISCLSGSMYKVLATPLMRLAQSMLSDCKVVSTVMVPIQRPIRLENGSSPVPVKDLILTWNVPDCQDCQALGPSTTNLSNTGNILMDTSTKDYQYKMALGLVIPVFTLTILLVCYMFYHMKICSYCFAADPLDFEHNHHAEPPSTAMVIMVGLDGTTIESYPKLILGESRRIPTPNDGTCSICLSEYRSKDIIRCIPDCKHWFHANCIDEWLSLNASCPMCRTCPSPLHNL